MSSKFSSLVQLTDSLPQKCKTESLLFYVPKMFSVFFYCYERKISKLMCTCTSSGRHFHLFLQYNTIEFQISKNRACLKLSDLVQNVDKLF